MGAPWWRTSPPAFMWSRRGPVRRGARGPPRRGGPPVEVEDEKFFFRVVYAAFALRRKTLVNSLMTAFGSQLTKEQVTQAVTSCGLEANIRGERLGLSEFAALAKAIHALV